MDHYPVARDLVLAGGGHSHVIALKMLAMKPIPGVKVTLISPDVATPYSGMLPGLIAGHYQPDDMYIDLVPLARFAGARFIRGGVESLDIASQTVSVSGRPPIRYDCLSIDVGSTPSLGGLPAGEVIPVKPIARFLDRWLAFVAKLNAGGVSSIGFVGAGAGGVELCLSVVHYLEQNHSSTIKVHLFTDGKTILKDYPTSVKIRFERLLDEKRVTVHRDFRASAISDGQLLSLDGREVALDEVFCVTQASAQAWPKDAGLESDADGFVKVRDSLQVPGHDNIFAVGDCATMINYPRPKAGVYAVRQGAPLTQNLTRFLLGENVTAYRPQSQFLSLIATGPKRAVASRNGFSIEAGWVWHWKNWIDQKFMQRFSELPAMQVESPNRLFDEFDAQMQCGGCGSKVGAEMLGHVLGDLLGDDVPSDDAALIAIPEGKVLLQSVDHFRSLLDDPYRQARIAVCHALSDVYACGGEAHSVMALLTLPFARPGVTESLLRQIMAGTLDQLSEEGAALKGGHTSEGVELSIGFAVNGVVDPDKIRTKQGLRIGDVLVLTKPLGTGAILAADMQFRARGAHVESAVVSMMQSNRQAAHILTDFDVSACTDITGFGLAGHCVEMIRATSVGIAFDLSALPMLPGALDTIRSGITSSLHDTNARAVAMHGLAGGKAPLLFDPQTSGGLLAGLPASEAGPCIERLRQAGYAGAAIVGVVTDAAGRLTTSHDE